MYWCGFGQFDSTTDWQTVWGILSRWVEGLSGYPGQVPSRVFQRARLTVCFSVKTRCFCASECAWSFVKGNNGAASPFAVRLLLPGNLNTVRLCSLYTARWLLLCWFQGTIRLQMLLLCCYCKYSGSAYCYIIVLHPQTLTFITQPNTMRAFPFVWEYFNSISSL